MKGMKVIVSTTLDKRIRSLLAKRRVKLRDVILIGALVCIKGLKKDKVELIGEDKHKVIIKVNNTIVEIPSKFKEVV